VTSSTEHWSLIGSVGVVTIVAVAALARRIGVHAGWVLPPVLYATALRMPVVDLRRDIKAISLLVIALVVATTVAVGLLVDSVLPGLGLPGSFALGATLGPTDAVTATSTG